VTEEADNNGFLSHSTGLSLDNSLPSFQEYAPWLRNIRDWCNISDESALCTLYEITDNRQRAAKHKAQEEEMVIIIN